MKSDQTQSESTSCHFLVKHSNFYLATCILLRRGGGSCIIWTLNWTNWFLDFFYIHMSCKMSPILLNRNTLLLFVYGLNSIQIYKFSNLCVIKCIILVALCSCKAQDNWTNSARIKILQSSFTKILTTVCQVPQLC